MISPGLRFSFGSVLEPGDFCLGFGVIFLLKHKSMLVAGYRRQVNPELGGYMRKKSEIFYVLVSGSCG